MLALLLVNYARALNWVIESVLHIYKLENFYKLVSLDSFLMPCWHVTQNFFHYWKISNHSFEQIMVFHWIQVFKEFSINSKQHYLSWVSKLFSQIISVIGWHAPNLTETRAPSSQYPYENPMIESSIIKIKLSSWLAKMVWRYIWSCFWCNMARPKSVAIEILGNSRSTIETTNEIR